jgi:transcriptional regulator with XRE-family HTH domain
MAVFVGEPKSLKEAREIVGLTQSQLASLIGVTQAFISRVEHGNREPSLELAELWAAMLRLTLGQFSLFVRQARTARKAANVAINK